MGQTIRQTRFESLPTGSYPAVIGAVALEEGQFGQQVKIRFDLTDPPGRSIMGWASANFSAKSKLYGWVKAAIFAGTEVPPDYDLDIDHLLDRPVMVTLIEREGDDGQPFNKIDGVKPMRGTGAQPRPPISPAPSTIPQSRPVTAAGAAGVRPPAPSGTRTRPSSASEPPDWPEWPGADSPPF